MRQHACPTCNRMIETNPRYPYALCMDCVELSKDENGYSLRFFNTHLSGGLAGIYVKSGAPYEGSNCYVNGIYCHVEERYMGGVVIIPVEHID